MAWDSIQHLLKIAICLAPVPQLQTHFAQLQQLGDRSLDLTIDHSTLSLDRGQR